MTWPLRAAYATGVSGVSDQGDGRGEQPRPATPAGAELIGLSAVIAVSVIVPLAVGLVLDGRLHSSPLGLLLGLVAGIAAAAVTVVNRLRKYL